MAVINYYYGVEQRNSLSELANEEALYVDKYFPQNPTQNPKSNFALFNAAQMVLKLSPPNNQQYWMIVFNANGIPVYPNLQSPVYPSLPNNKPPVSPKPLPFPGLTLELSGNAREQVDQVSPKPLPSPGLPLVVRAGKLTTAESEAMAIAVANRLRSARTVALKSVLQLVNLSIQPDDFEKFQQAIVNALYGKHLRADEEFSRENPFGDVQPFSVRPISAGTKVVGALLVTPRSNVVPPFVTTVGMAVLVASIVITVLAVLAAILFSRPITISLAKLTTATRLLAKGDYSVQVSTRAPGELGELARNFNEMAVQLKQDVEELQRQEIWRRELIMNITHDLATPLTAIAGLGEALVDGVNHSHEDYEATGRVIVRETLRLHRLVQDLHVMAKLEAKAVQPKKKSIRLAALVDEVLAVLAPEFERCGVEPINSVPYNLKPVQADADLLTRVFSNLCGNSLRHTPPGGHVIIEAIEQSKWLVISVTDTGEGIGPEFLPYIFDRFRQAEGTASRQHGGLGLGLAIVRHLVELHGGTVDASSEGIGLGATFTTTFPLIAVSRDGSDVEHAGNRSLDNSCLALKGMRVLVVDDQQDARDLVTIALTQGGAEVRASTSAREALEVLAQWKPDVLVADIGMPTEDGYELIKRVRALQPERAGTIPAVALTGYASDEDAARARVAGYQLHIPKPVSPSELVAKVANLIMKARHV